MKVFDNGENDKNIDIVTPIFCKRFFLAGRNCIVCQWFIHNMRYSQYRPMSTHFHSRAQCYARSILPFIQFFISQQVQKLSTSQSNASYTCTTDRDKSVLVHLYECVIEGGGVKHEHKFTNTKEKKLIAHIVHFLPVHTMQFPSGQIILKDINS